MKKFLSLAFFLSVFFAFTSCSKDDDEAPAQASYVGTWTIVDGFVDGFGAMEMTLTSNTYQQTIYMGPIPFWGSKGTISLNGDIMTMTETEVGALTEDGTMVFYKAGTQDYIDNDGDSTPLVSKIKVEGNSLTMMNDANEDGVFAGEGDEESMVFTRK